MLRSKESAASYFQQVPLEKERGQGARAREETLDESTLLATLDGNLFARFHFPSWDQAVNQRKGTKHLKDKTSYKS